MKSINLLKMTFDTKSKKQYKYGIKACNTGAWSIYGKLKNDK